ncbi:MAG: hypothetical protein QM653_05425 [Dysgonomonas sp.]|uniref:hypothetical protein n=1 Tax=Dysgonomonas TaxID=156973 RepID=UPI003341214B
MKKAFFSILCLGFSIFFYLQDNYFKYNGVADNFTYQDKAIGHYSFGRVFDLWNTGSATLWQSAYAGIKFFTARQYRMGINTNY